MSIHDQGHSKHVKIISSRSRSLQADQCHFKYQILQFTVEINSFSDWGQINAYLRLPRAEWIRPRVDKCKYLLSYWRLTLIFL